MAASGLMVMKRTLCHRHRSLSRDRHPPAPAARVLLGLGRVFRMCLRADQNTQVKRL